MPFRLETLKADPQAVDHLRSAFDLYLNIANYPDPLITVDGARNYARFGRNVTGGVFVALPDGRILYGSSEGEGGIVAADFDAFIRLIVARPYWLEILSYSGNGDLRQMRRAAPALAAYHAGDDDVAEGEAYFAAHFAMTDPTADPIGSLHRAVSSTDVVIRSRHGVAYLSLFGGRIVDQAPFLRDFAR